MTASDYKIDVLLSDSDTTRVYILAENAVGLNGNFAKFAQWCLDEFNALPSYPVGWVGMQMSFVSEHDLLMFRLKLPDL